MGSGRTMKGKDHQSWVQEEPEDELARFCSDEALRQFYEEKELLCKAVPQNEGAPPLAI